MPTPFHQLGGDELLDEIFEQDRDNMPTLYILQGIAGAGKSTLAKKMIAEQKAAVYWEADMWMVDDMGNYVFDPTKLYYAHSRCRQTIEWEMQVGNNVIQSNTNLHRKDVNPYLELAKQYDYQVVVIRLKSDFGSIHNVPPDKIASMKDLLDKFDYSNLPDFVTVEEHNAPTPMQETFDRVTT